MNPEMVAQSLSKLEKSPCRYIETVAVKEQFKGQTVWDGEIMVFALDRPPEERCYVWVDRDENRMVTVLERPPVNSAETALRAYLVSKK